METNTIIKSRVEFIARKLGITLEEAKKMKADALKPPKKEKKETFKKIEELDNGES